jgi:helix-turn-helix, Psq domain
MAILFLIILAKYVSSINKAFNYYIEQQSSSTAVEDTKNGRRPKGRKYSQVDVDNALEALRTSECTSFREASDKFGVPATTLHDKLHGTLRR